MPYVNNDTTSSSTGSSLIWPGWASSSTTSSITTNVWDQWVQTTGTSAANTVTITSSTASTVTATTTGTDVFVQWVSPHQTGSATATNIDHTDPVFIRWTSEGQEGNRLHRPRVEFIRSAPRETEEQRAERRRREAERHRIAEEARRQREEANERAMALLRSVLNDGQRRDLERHDYFFVRGQSGRLYRIGKGRQGNVKVVDPVTKQWTESLCIHQRDMVPVGDTMLMQKLMIETAEAHFRAYANISYKGGGCQTGRRGLLDRERLAEVIPFPEREAA